MKKWLTIFVFSIFYILVVPGFIVPDEIPTALSIIYSNIPKIQLGSDSRLGWGFRIGNRADAQVVLELGPQRYTQPLDEVSIDEGLLISKRNSRLSRLRRGRKRGTEGEKTIPESQKPTEKYVQVDTDERRIQNLVENLDGEALQRIDENVLKDFLSRLKTNGSAQNEERYTAKKSVERIEMNQTKPQLNSIKKEQENKSMVRQVGRVGKSGDGKNTSRQTPSTTPTNSLRGILSNILTNVRTFVGRSNTRTRNTNVPTSRNQIQLNARRNKPSPSRQNSNVKIQNARTSNKQNTPNNLLNKLKENGVGILTNIFKIIEEKKKALYPQQRKPTQTTPKTPKERERVKPKPPNPSTIKIPQTTPKETLEQTQGNETKTSGKTNFIDIVENRIREIMKEAQKKSLSDEARRKINKEISDIQQLLVVLKNNTAKENATIEKQPVHSVLAKENYFNSTKVPMEISTRNRTELDQLNNKMPVPSLDCSNISCTKGGKVEEPVGSNRKLKEGKGNQQKSAIPNPGYIRRVETRKQTNTRTNSGLSIEVLNLLRSLWHPQNNRNIPKNG